MGNIDLEFNCEKCGKPLNISQSRDTIEIEPCRHCFDAEYERGVDDGRKHAESESEEE